jgi:hypothetical protein
MRGHLEVIALALVVGGSGHHVLVRNGVGLDGVEFETWRWWCENPWPRRQALRGHWQGRRHAPAVAAAKPSKEPRKGKLYSPMHDFPLFI